MAPTLQDFFTGKLFLVPSYQRDFAWERKNVQELLDDVLETIELKTKHYLGAFILSGPKEDGVFRVVDGQQRLTCLTMILNAVIARLPDTKRIINHNLFIRDVEENRLKLQLSEYNQPFFAALLEGRKLEHKTKSQALLIEANEFILEVVEALLKRFGSLEEYLGSIKKLEVMQFVEEDESRAIRIFQTVNDRGRPLTNVEKAKSLLIYYSNRFLSGRHDAFINEAFGEVFRDFARIEVIAEDAETKIDLIANKNFNEDSVMRYHFLSFKNETFKFEEKFNQKATANDVLDHFLKKRLPEKKGDAEELSRFVEQYVSDLRSFFRSFRALVERVQVDARYYKLFCVLGPSTFLYPLLIRLNQRGVLDQPISDGTPLTFADLVEIADLRIYKTRGTDPAKDVSLLACDVPTAPSETIVKTLGEIVKRFMPDSQFDSKLAENMYDNAGLLHILIEAGEDWAMGLNRAHYTLQLLKTLNKSEPTIEHVFSQKPRFLFPGHEFGSEEEYERLNHTLGNLTILEKELNSRCQNEPPEKKLVEANLYKQSSFDTTKAMVAAAAANKTDFNAGAVRNRTKFLAEFAKKRWPLWA